MILLDPSVLSIINHHSSFGSVDSVDPVDPVDHVDHVDHYINGTPQSSDHSFSVINPLTGHPIATVSDGGPVETRQAIDSAFNANQTWKATPLTQRAHYVSLLGQAMLDHQDSLGRLLTLEQGKPLKEAISEIRYAASFLFSAADESKCLSNDMIPSPFPNKQLMVWRQPFGVVACITPWNFPAAMLTRKIGPALAVGNTVVIKPSDLTPLSAFAIGQLAHNIGFPPGVINLIYGRDAASISDEMLSSPKVRKLSFTGSTQVGKSIIQRSSQHITKLSLELGGHAPFIVCDDTRLDPTHLDQAIQAAVACKYRNMGQTCICANRFYIHQNIFKDFLSGFKSAVSSLISGNGLHDHVSLGPLIHKHAQDKVHRHVQDALHKGAQLELGGHPLHLSDFPNAPFYEPTILTHCHHDMLVFREETFGPVSAFMSFESDEDVLKWANDTSYGLAAYVFTQDIQRAFKFTEALDYGIVGVNDGSPSTAHAPFGGVKSSGIGREGGRYGIEAFSELKYVSLGL